MPKKDNTMMDLYKINAGKEKVDWEYCEELPDEWFVWLQSKSGKMFRSAEKRADKSLSLSRKGFEANKEKIKEDYLQLHQRRAGDKLIWEMLKPNDWDQLLVWVEEGFQNIEKDTKKYLKDLKENVAYAQKVLELVK
jgi:hypothetical protein